MRPASLVLSVVLQLAGPSAAGQVVSDIGWFLQPWGAVWPIPADMTSDGEWIVFVESTGDGCTGITEQRLSMIRTDGTDYRVVIDESTMAALEPDFETLVRTLVVSGNGQWAVFAWPHKVTVFCAELSPTHWYLVDLMTSSLDEILFNGVVVGGVSLTDDGQTMAFKGYDPVADSWDFYRSAVTPTPTAGEVEMIPVVSSLNPVLGKISGNGRNFGFFASSSSVCPCPAEVLVYDFQTGVTTTVTPAPAAGGIGIFDIADTGQRVIYATGGNVFGIASDGSDHHLVVGPIDGISAALSVDGSLVVVGLDPPAYESLRVPWEGGSTVTAPVLGGSSNVIPMNADASVIAGWNFAIPAVYPPLGVWYEHTPVLTTYGYGTPGTTLSWDVGGVAGDTYILAFSFGPAALPFQNYGTLGLDPASLQILSAGPIAGPGNVAQVTVALPSDLVVPSPVPVYFQALVLEGDGQGGQLTNTTAFTISAAQSATAADSSDPAPAPAAGAMPAWARRPTAPQTPEEMALRLLLQDPEIWMAEARAGRSVVLPPRR